MKNRKEKVERLFIQMYTVVTEQFKNLTTKQDGFGMNEVLGIATAIILAGFIFIPQLKAFADSVITSLTTWWGTNSTKIFQNIP